MKLTGGYDTAFEAAREQVIATLRTYRLERLDIQRQKALVSEALESLCYVRPSSDGYGVKSQMQEGDAAMVRALVRIAVERSRLETEARLLDEREEKLNRYLQAIGKLPVFERRVMVGIYIDGKKAEDVGAELERSLVTVVRYRKAAIRELTCKLFGFNA